MTNKRYTQNATQTAFTIRVIAEERRATETLGTSVSGIVLDEGAIVGRG